MDQAVRATNGNASNQGQISANGHQARPASIEPVAGHAHDPGLNRVVLSGRLASEPQLLATDVAGTACLLRLECASRRPAGRKGSVEDSEPLSFDVLILGKVAEKVAPYLYRGRTVAIDGSLESASWESDGPREEQGVCILAHRVQFIGPPPQGQTRARRDRPPTGRPMTNQPAPARPATDALSIEDSIPVGFSDEVWL
jgi:single-stranded DNA-binding protein